MPDFVVKCDFRPQKVAILFRTSYIVAGEIPYPVSVAHGGTGSTNAAGARTALGALGASDIANNLTTDTEGKVLDARQGKALKDAVDAKVNTSDVIDDLVSTDTDKPLSANQGKVLADRVTPVANGGTGASTVANARTNLSVYSKSETDSAIAQSTAPITAQSFDNLDAIVAQMGGNVPYTALVSSGTGSPQASNNKWFVMGFANQSYTWAAQMTFSFGQPTMYYRNRSNSSTWPSWIPANAQTASFFMFSSNDYNTWGKLFNGISSATQYYTNTVYLGPTAANILMDGKIEGTALWGTFVRTGSTSASFILTTSSSDNIYKVILSNMNSTSRTTTVRKITMTTM